MKTSGISNIKIFCKPMLPCNSSSACWQRTAHKVAGQIQKTPTPISSPIVSPRALQHLLALLKPHGRQQLDPGLIDQHISSTCWHRSPGAAWPTATGPGAVR